MLLISEWCLQVLLAGAKVFTDEKVQSATMLLRAPPQQQLTSSVLQLGKHSVVSKAGPVRTDREQMPLLEPDVEIRIRSQA